MPYSRHTLRFRDAPALHFYRIPVRTRRNGFRPAPPSYGRASRPTAGCSRTSGRDSRRTFSTRPSNLPAHPANPRRAVRSPWPSPDRLPSGLFPMPGQKSGGSPDTARYLNKSGRSRSVRSNACCSCHFSISAKLPTRARPAPSSRENRPDAYRPAAPAGYPENSRSAPNSRRRSHRAECAQRCRL